MTGVYFINSNLFPPLGSPWWRHGESPSVEVLGGNRFWQTMGWLFNPITSFILFSADTKWENYLYCDKQYFALSENSQSVIHSSRIFIVHAYKLFIYWINNILNAEVFLPSTREPSFTFSTLFWQYTGGINNEHLTPEMIKIRGESDQNENKSTVISFLRSSTCLEDAARRVWSRPESYIKSYLSVLLPGGVGESGLAIKTAVNQ